DAEVEPWLAVNPTSGAYAVAWQQDRWGDPNEGGAHALVSWSSVGSTVSWAPFTRCSGGTAAHGDYDRASDVWLSYGPDGRLYEAALPFDWFTGRNAVTASSSTDDARTWSTPAVVVSSDQKSSRTASTRRRSRPTRITRAWRTSSSIAIRIRT